MFSEITFQYPSWYILLCILLGLVYATVLYYRDKKFSDISSLFIWLMALLRFLSVTGISLLLLSPFVKSISEDIKQPIIVIAEDASQSVVANMSANEIINQKESINNLANSLSQKYDVKRISFGDNISANPVDSFSHRVTNMSNSLEYIYDNFSDQNLGAIIMSTDGIYNEGKNPLYANVKLTSPLYFIAQGDTTVRKDLLIKNVFNNKIAYLGDKFSTQVDVSAKNCQSNNTILTISKLVDGKLTKLKTESIRINKNDFFTTKELVLDANTIGLNKYRISLTPINGEISTKNNYKDIFIEVLDARQKILVLSNGRHPDLSAIKTILTQNKNYEVDIHFPGQNFNTNNYDLVVFHNLPSDKFSIDAELAIMKRSRIPRLFIVGAQTSLDRLNKVQQNIKVSGNSASHEDILGDINTSFNTFTLSKNLSSKLKAFPPLIAPFGQYTNPAGANVLLTQNIKKIPTKYPLLSFKDRGGYKVGVWVGEGIWKWRLFDFLDNNNYEAVTEILNKTIQYLSTKEDKRKFRVSTSKNLYKENEQILFDAQLYNSNYELINEPDVFLTLTNKSNKQFQYNFSRANKYYTLNSGMLPPGRYNYISKTNLNGEALEQKGSFSIQKIQLELYNLTARHDLLRTLSNKYGGAVMLPSETTKLSEEVLNNNKIKPVIYPSTETTSIINFRWLFGLILFLLSLEWFLRRYKGSY